MFLSRRQMKVKGQRVHSRTAHGIDKFVLISMPLYCKNFHVTPRQGGTHL